MVASARSRAAAAASSALPPASRTSAAASTAKPVEIPTWRLSTGTTGIDASRAASWADSKVPLMSPEMWTETIDVAPSAAAFSKTSSISAGAGREVLTGRNSRSASATSSGVAPSAPSSYDVAPITTWSGTTTMPRASATSGGNDAVESVTSTVRDMARPYPARRVRR